MVRNAPWVNSVYSSSRGVRISDQGERRFRSYSRNFAHILDINVAHRTFFCSTILWITLPLHGDR